MTDQKVAIRDRITGFKRVPASELIPHPENWRKHPDGQRQVLAALFEEIGIAGAVLARETDRGLELIDGHLRQEELAAAGDHPVPVLTVDLTDAEARKLLATFDPLSAMATTDGDALAELLDQVETDSDEIQALLDRLAEDNEINLDSDAGDSAGTEAAAEEYEVVIRCRSEREQKALYEELAGRGLDCRLQAQ